MHTNRIVPRVRTAIVGGGPSTSSLLANVIHVGMNRVLILGAFGVPAMGPRGAGISTAVTRPMPITRAGARMIMRCQRGSAASIGDTVAAPLCGDSGHPGLS